METTLTGKPNKRKAEALANPLWNAGIYSQIIEFRYGKNVWNLYITTSEKEHNDIIKEIDNCYGATYQVFYKFNKLLGIE